MTMKETIAYLRLVHGSYNFIVMFLFAYQAYLGVTVRSNRINRSFVPKIVRHHRRYGPPLVIIGIIGYLAGLALVYVDRRAVFKYPLHLAVGTLIVVLLIATFFISRKIKGASSPWRTRHYVVGGFILFLYFVQTLIGIGILF